jgi:hypothetical protein
LFSIPKPASTPTPANNEDRWCGGLHDAPDAGPDERPNAFMSASDGTRGRWERMPPDYRGAWAASPPISRATRLRANQSRAAERAAGAVRQRVPKRDAQSMRRPRSREADRRSPQEMLRTAR